MSLFKSETATAKEIKKYRKELSRNPDNMRLHIKLGELYLKDGNKDEALIYYRNALIYYANNNYYLKAISIAKQMIKIDQEKVGVADLLMDLYSRAGFCSDAVETQQQFELSRTPECVEDFETETVAKEFSEDETPPWIAPKTPLFTDLTQDEFIELVQKLKSRTFKEGEFIYRQEEKGDSIYIIVTGSVKISKVDPEGNLVDIMRLSEGDFFGEGPYFLDESRVHSARAETETEIFEMEKKELDNVIAKYPRVRELLERAFCERVTNSLLAVLPIFSTLDMEEREAVRNLMEIKVYEAGQDIFAKGEMSQAFYFINNGKVEIYSEEGAESTSPVAILSKGHFLGIISSIEVDNENISAKAASKTEILEISPENLNKVLKTYPDIIEDYEARKKALLSEPPQK